MSGLTIAQQDAIVDAVAEALRRQGRPATAQHDMSGAYIISPGEAGAEYCAGFNDSPTWTVNVIDAAGYLIDDRNTWVAADCPDPDFIAAAIAAAIRRTA